MKKFELIWSKKEEGLLFVSEGSFKSQVGFVVFDRVSRLWRLFISPLDGMGEIFSLVNFESFTASFFDKKSVMLWLEIKMSRLLR